MKNPKINLTAEQKAEMINDLQQYFINERDEELGHLAATIMLDFILAKLGPAMYNQGVYDAYKYINDRNEDLLGIQIL
jgi:uncharacterized protein (DUF2164 family)